MEIKTEGETFLTWSGLFRFLVSLFVTHKLFPITVSPSKNDFSLEHAKVFSLSLQAFRNLPLIFVLQIARIGGNGNAICIVAMVRRFKPT